VTEYDRLTTDGWTVVLPSDWNDKSESETTYFESPDGTMGVYIAVWCMGDDEEQSPAELVEAFVAIELESILDGNSQGQVLAKDVEHVDGSVVCVWDTYSAVDVYRVAGKIQAKGKYVLRATFHDYACEEYDLSKQKFAPIIASLRLSAD
jgi:hypothetical protein